MSWINRKNLANDYSRRVFFTDMTFPRKQLQHDLEPSGIIKKLGGLIKARQYNEEQIFTEWLASDSLEELDLDEIEAN
jgi:hypothetical protein